MGNWLNTYQKVTSQTGKPVTLFTDHAPWRDNPWIEIQGAGRRYRNNGKGGWEIQQISQSSGTWDPVNVIDEEYWTNYVNDIDNKRKETPALNIFLKLFGIEGKTPEKAFGGKVLKGYKGIKTNRPTDISNITDDLVANLMYDRSMLGGENTKLELGTNHAYPDIWLYGDSTSTVDGSKWKVEYHSMPGGIFTTDPAVFSRSAEEVDDDGNFTGKKEYRSFNYFYPEPEKPNSNSDAHNTAAKNGGTYTYSGNKENYLEDKFFTDFYKEYLLNQKSGGKVQKGGDGMLTKAAKNIAKKFGWAESRIEETEPLSVRNIETNPYVTRNQYRIEDPTYGRVITSYKVPGLSNDTSWYMRPGTMETVTPGGTIGNTILNPTDGKYILNSWNNVPIDVNQEENLWIKDEVYIPESEAKKYTYWFNLPHYKGLKDIQYRHGSTNSPSKKDFLFKQGGKISDLLNNQEFLVNLEKCGGKMKKKACGGKMKKKK